MKYNNWSMLVDDKLPWPDIEDVFEILGELEPDHAEDRIDRIKEVLKAHRDASRSGVFNDE